MKKYFGFLPLIFIFCNLHAIRFISVIDGQEKEAPDRITFKNDLYEKVTIAAKAFLLDGCFPIDEFSLKEQTDYCFEGPDAWGLYWLQVTRSRIPFVVNFSGES